VSASTADVLRLGPTDAVEHREMESNPDILYNVPANLKQAI